MGDVARQSRRRTQQLLYRTGLPDQIRGDAALDDAEYPAHDLGPACEQDAFNRDVLLREFIELFSACKQQEIDTIDAHMSDFEVSTSLEKV